MSGEKKKLEEENQIVIFSGTFLLIEERVAHQDSWSFKTTPSSCVTKLSATEMISATDKMVSAIIIVHKNGS